MALANARRLSRDAALDPIATGARLAARTVFVGTNGDDVLTGTAGNDLFKPKLGYDTVVGGDGFDKLKIVYAGPEYQGDFTAHSFRIHSDGVLGILNGDHSSCAYNGIESIIFTSSDGYDQFGISVNSDIIPNVALVLDGGGGEDLLGIYANYNSVALEIAMQMDGTVTSTIGTFTSFAVFQFYLGYSDDTVSGIDGALWGGTGDDMLGGGAGSSILRGDGGADVLSGGGGADTFEYIARGDSGRNPGIDVITDFSHAEGDRIVLAFDADKLVRKDQDFTFIGTAAFSGAAGELRFTDNGDGSYTVEGNLDATPDAEFTLTVHADAPLIATDFSL